MALTCSSQVRRTGGATTGQLPKDSAVRADQAFVTHVTWALERTPGMVIRVRPEFVLPHLGFPCATFNVLLRPPPAGAGLKSVGLEAFLFFSNVQRPFSWWVGPADTPRDLGVAL